MTGLGLLVLVSTVVLASVMVASIWLMNRVSTRWVGDRHRALQTIFETGETPKSWGVPYEKRLHRLSGEAGNAGRIAALHEQERQEMLKRLDGLIRYVQTSSLVDGEDSRALLLEKLSAVRADWQGRR